VIATVLRISRLNLSRDRVALAMMFVLPVAFFSIFATIFGQQSRRDSVSVQLALADEDRSEASRALARAGAGELAAHRKGRAPARRGSQRPRAGTRPRARGAARRGRRRRGGARDPCGLRRRLGRQERAAARPAARRPLERRRRAARAWPAAEGCGDGATQGARAPGLLEEVEAGTLDRLLTSPLGMGRLLAGKWLFITLMGVLQLTVMFTWGRLVFGLDLLSHLPGFLAMTLATAGAAAGFGLLLATACRSRGQLSGVATIVILMMSSLGGSMFPRFLMSERIQKLGLLTFNGWALDGYIKVFWRNAPLVELWPQLLALVVLGAAFMAAARRLAQRWETV
jgi:hypothetical protein